MVQFDYNSILARITNSLKSTNSWADILLTGVNQNLLNSIAQEMAYNMTAQEYYTSENWWLKAQNLSSLLVESPVHGYVVPRKVGATGTLYISTDPSIASILTNPNYVPTASPANIPLPQYFQFSNGTYYVCLDSATTLTQGTSYISVAVTEGKHLTVNWISQGLPWETKIINETSLENYQYQLYVNGTVWTRVDSLYTASSTDQVYEINYDPSLTFFTIRFGNGVFGQQLPSGNPIEFDYISTDGINGNITSTNNVTTVVDQAYTSTGLPIEIYVTNPSGIVGGSDYPSIEQVRNTSPLVYQSGDRASSISDYETVIGNLPYIGKVVVWGSVEYNSDNGYSPMQFIPLEQNLVHMALLGPAPSFLPLDTTTENELITYIHNISDPTDLISFETPIVIDINFIVKAYVKNSSYSLASVQGNIDLALQNTYGIANRSFAEPLYNSDVISLIDSVTGVKYHDTILQMIQFYNFATPYTASFTLPAVSSSETLNLTSVSFYVNSVANPTTWTLVGTGNANGGIDGVVGGAWGVATSSGINPATGSGNLILSPPVNADPYDQIEVKVTYESNSADLVTTFRSQIFAYYSSQITMAYASN